MESSSEVVGAMIRLNDLAQLLDGAEDAAFAVSLDGSIRTWNDAAERMFRVPNGDALRMKCFDLLQGQEAGGEPVCRPCCALRELAAAGRTTACFDMKVRIGTAHRWASVTPIIFRRSSATLAIHIIRDTDSRSRLEEATRHFLDQVAAVTGERIEQLLGPRPAPHARLTAREVMVLHRLTNGDTTRSISAKLGVSRATVRNHVQHILVKLGAHSRTQAVLRALRERRTAR
jgi:DNA-binding NarL/FixJ family response regulator